MRSDAVGMFWEDALVTNGRREAVRIMPPIPDTGWRAPTSFPNLAAAKILAIDVEAYDPELLAHGPGWARGKSRLVGASIGTEDGYRWYFPWGHEVEGQDNLPRVNCLNFLRDTLGNPKQTKVGANLLYDIGTLRSEGVTVRGDLVDVQFAEALLDERANVNLEELGKKYLGVGKQSNLLYEWCAKFYGGKPNGAQRANIYRSPPRLVGPYAESDVDLPIRIAREIYPCLVKEGLYELFLLECRLIPLLIEMRVAGVHVDVAKAEILRESLLKEADEERAKLKELVGMPVDINASQSIAKAFDHLGYNYNRTAPTKNHPKGQPSFTKEFLTTCKNPVADSINLIRKLDKLRGTFVESYILESHVNGMVYCQFHPLREDEGGTRSGRFSSSTPNLQNIPVRDEKWGPLLRGLFIPDVGHVAWRKYDYSQIEYRMLVHFAVGPGADEARSRYNDDPDTDYHEWALDLVALQAGWDISTPEKRKYARRPVKNLNFGMIFGQGEEHTAEVLHMKLKEARLLFAAYHRGVPFAKPTMAACSKEAQELGYVTTLLGRRSRFDLWETTRRYPKDQEGPPPLPFDLAIRTYGSIRRAYTYRGLNRRLQGSAADVLKVAMVLCWEAGVFAATGIPRLTVHDELDFSDPGGRDEAFLEMKHIMETAIKLTVPIRADLDIGPDWGHVKGVQ